MQHETQRALGLLDLLAAHAARTIDHKDDRLGRRLLVRGFDLGTGQQQEITVLSGVRAVTDDAGANLAGPHVVHQAEVRSGDLVERGQRDRGMLVVGALDLDRVRRAVDVLDIRTALDGYSNVELFDRVRRVLGRAQREQEVGQALVLAAQLRVAQRHLPLGTGGDGEHAGLEHAAADPFQQRRVAVFAHRLFVNPPRLVGPQEFGRVFLAVDQQRQSIDGPVVRQRKDEADFHLPAARVDERLRDLHLRHLIVQIDVDRQLLDLVRALRNRQSDAGRATMHDRSRQRHLLARSYVHEQPLGVHQAALDE